MPEKYYKKDKVETLLKKSFKVNFNNLFIVSILLLAFVILITFGLWGYKLHLKENIEKASAEIDNLQGQRDFEAEKEFSTLKVKIEDFKKILEGHIYPSNIFEMLEELTIPEVDFFEMQANLLDNEISIKAESDDYNSLARQIVVFENDDRIKEIDLSGVVLNDRGKVNSVLTIETSSNFLYSK